MSFPGHGSKPAVLVTFALKSEARVFLRRVRAQALDNSLYLGRAGDVSVAIFLVGIGAPRSEALASILRNYRPKLVISSGFAGAVASQHSAGAFVLATNFTDLAQERFPQRDSHFDAEGLFKQVQSVLGPAAKAELGSSGLQAIDMESETVARTCREQGIPVLTARMISDSAHEGIPGIFLGKRLSGPSEAVAAGRFAFRMLRLTTALADRLCELLAALYSEIRTERDRDESDETKRDGPSIRQRTRNDP
jgi:uridine phosphorylase